jgi:hypothetical protein
MKEKKDLAKRIGGLARAEALSDEERAAIARKAAIARWGEKPFKVIRKGNFKKDFGVDIDCYVLDDPQKTAVISKRGMGLAIGLRKRGDSFPVFVNSKNMEDYIGRELKEKIENPLIFQPKSSAGENPINEQAHGYDATILIDICTSILNARNDGKLSETRYARMVNQAQVIQTASAKSGIKGLVYALAGYDPSAQEVIDAFKLYIQEEARKYEPEFPDDLYMQWYRLYQIQVPQRGKPWQFKHLTVNHIYYPLAQSKGKIYELVKALKAKDGDRRKKLFQFLNDIGVRALRMHMGRVLEMCESSENRDIYESKIKKRFGGQQELFESTSTS